MTAHVLKGTKQQIVHDLVQIAGEVREAIVFVEEPADERGAIRQDCEDIFAEMRPLMVDVQNVDDSREAVYTRLEGE